jgi:hypothetical protein
MKGFKSYTSVLLLLSLLCYKAVAVARVVQLVAGEWCAHLPVLQQAAQK